MMILLNRSRLRPRTGPRALHPTKTKALAADAALPTACAPVLNGATAPNRAGTNVKYNV